MKIVIYSAKPYDKSFFNEANKQKKHKLKFRKETLTIDTVRFSKGYDCVCVSVRDTVDEEVLIKLKENNISVLALRSAGYDHVALEVAKELNIKVINVPQYSPYAIAEHTVMLMLTLNRKVKESFERVQSYNFSLDGLLGFDMHEKTVGIIGCGKIGLTTAKILKGFGCNVIAYSRHDNPECKKIGVRQVSLDTLFASSDIITLHCPLTPKTKYLINAETIKKMKTGVMIINTARGELLDTKAVISGLVHKKIGYLGLDVYEKEKGTFFEDKSEEGIHDKNLETLLSFPNVLITSHQASFTREAKSTISNIVLKSIQDLEQGKEVSNLL